MDRLLEPFTQSVKSQTESSQIPFISNVTGTWITAEEATDPSWHEASTSNRAVYSRNLPVAARAKSHLVEVGPGHLVYLALQHTEQAAGQASMFLRHPQDQQSDLALLLNILGRLWLAGVPVNWSGFMLTSNVTVCLYQLTRLSASVTGLKRSKANPVRVKSSSKGQISLTGFMFLPGNEYPGRNAACHVCGNSVMLLGFVDECGLGEQIAQRPNKQGRMSSP